MFSPLEVFNIKFIWFNIDNFNFSFFIIFCLVLGIFLLLDYWILFNFIENLLFVIFIFITITNLLGLLSYTLCLSAYFSLTFFFSFFIWFLVLFLRFNNFNLYYFSIFVPNIPFSLSFLLIPIEIISNFSRIISLACRLASNMVAGHLLLNILAYFTILLGIYGIFSYAIILFIFLLEIFIAFLQGYVLFLLMNIYLDDSIFIIH